MSNVHIIKPLLRGLALVALAGTALLTGCADGPGTDTSTGPCPDGSTDCTTPLPVQCPSGQTFQQIAVDNAMVRTEDSNGLCIGCSVVNAIDTVDVYTNNFAIMTVSVGLLIAGNSITITDTKDRFPAGALAGFVVQVPDAPVLTASLLKTTRVTTVDNGADTADSAGANTPLALDLLGVLNRPDLAFVTAGTSTVPFDGARLNLGGLVNALSQLRVYGAGVCQ